MELRVQEVNGDLRAVVRDENGVDHEVNNVTWMSLEHAGSWCWEMELKAFFQEKSLH